MSTLTILWAGRRKAIKAAPSAPMSAVLSDACAAHGLQQNTGGKSYALYHKKALVDLSQPFRLTGIPQNTTLELKETATASGSATVRVGVKMSTGTQSLSNCFSVCVQHLL